jgi:HEAT repeat protein
MNITHILIVTLLLTCIAAAQPVSVGPRSQSAPAVATPVEVLAPPTLAELPSAFAPEPGVAALLGQLTAGSVGSPLAFLDGDDQDDPAYTLYKAGYKLILDEKWQEARRKLAEVIAKYSKGKYADDAQYWIAYSWKQSDFKKAIEAYKKFLKDYPKSNYYDDAVADLNRLEHPDAVPGVPVISPAIILPPSPVVSPAPVVPYTVAVPFSQEKVDDPELRMKMEALYALTRGKSDEKTFELLKGILFDKEQPREMREAALMGLRNQKDRDVSDVFVQILKNESDEQLKATAIYWLGQRAAEEKGGGEKTLTLLKQTAQDRSQPREVREAALRSLAMIKRPGALEFLVQVAKADSDKQVRQAALICISQVAQFDEQKAYQAMREFALDQNLDPELRESAFYSIRNFKKSDALDLYLQVAKNDPDARLRSAALYYIGEAGNKEPDQVFKIFKEFLLDPTQPTEVREAVMYSLTRLKTDQAFDLLLQVAKTDPDQHFQEAAIYHIGRMTKDRAKTLETLTSLFDAVPKDRVQTLNALLFSIANIGTDQAVEFLANVAKTNENFELRRTAIYHLGNIGGEKARAALYDILKGK